MTRWRRSGVALGLRGKLVTGLGSLLAILIAVTLLSNSVLDRYSGSIQKLFQQDYDSVAASQAMKEAVERMLHQSDGSDVAAFEKNLATQSRIADIPGESEATARLRDAWRLFRSSAGDTRAGRAAAVTDAAQTIIDMNLRHLESGRDTARSVAARAQWAMHSLAVVGIGVSIVIVALAGTIVLRPVRELEQSARRIAAGDLNRAVTVRTDDEIGHLGVAFNDMAAQLREFKRIDREKLLRTQHTTQLAIDSLPDAVVLIEPRGRIELANETAQRLFALRPGMSVMELSSPWLSDLHQQALTEAASSRPVGYSAAIRIDDAGAQRSFLPRTFPIFDERQNVIGSAVVLADVTELRRMDDMKNNLLATTAHELKTPLTSMRLVVHLVNEQRIGPLNERQRELLLAAAQDSDRLNRIVETLLDMDRLRGGKVLMDLRPILACQLVRECVTPVIAQIQSHGLELKLELAAPGALVRADARRITHVFGNLIANSLKYTPAGGTITVSAIDSGAGVHFSVADTGCGIPESMRLRVFERFFRAPGQSGESGTGLGLAIVREIVEAHGGRVWLDSRQNEGTIVHFVLPHVTHESTEFTHDHHARSSASA